MRALRHAVLAAALLGQADADENLSGAVRAAEIATLLRQVQGEDASDRLTAARVLVKNGNASLQPMCEALVHPDAWIREQATAALRDLENPSRQLLDAMLRAAGERTPQRRALLGALGRFTWGDPTLLGFWVGVAQDDDPVARVSALRWLASLPPTDEGVKAAASELERTPVEVMRLLASPLWWSFWTESRYADAAAHARRVALDTLARGEPWPRQVALRALGCGQSGDAETMHALVAATADPDWNVRGAAWLAIADLVEEGAAPPEALAAGFESAPFDTVPRLVDAVYGKEPRVVDGLRKAFAREFMTARLNLALALVRAGGRIDRPVIACIASWGPAGTSDEALRSIPGALEVVRAATASRAGDTSDFTRESAIRALGAFPPEVVKADLVKLLRCRDTFVLEATVQTLHRLGVGREETIAALVPLLRGRSVPHKIVASRLLLDIGVRGPAQAHALGECLLDPEDARYAAELIGRLGADAAPITPALVGALASRDNDVVLGASTALAQIGPSDRASYDAILGAAERTADLDWRPRANVTLRCAVWRALLEHPLLQAEDVAGLLRATAAHAATAYWYVGEFADVLARYGPREETRAIIVEMLAEPPHRLFAVRLLARIAPGGAELAAALLALIREGKPEERLEALVTAAEVGLHGDAVAVAQMQRLFPEFGEPEEGPGIILPPIDPTIVELCGRILLRPTGRVTALKAIQAITPPASEAIPSLRQLARRADPSRRTEIERTIQALGG